ncbi:MAG: PD40 domain-containing protein [Candidatus Marinimicrobia bacterium]|nr:PD40 domain-containing protein [Candidatus Neomarinimicrobiota bacterium]
MNRTTLINVLVWTLLSVACGEKPSEPEAPVEEEGGIILEGPPFFFDNPAWHPDGKWIAVEHGDSIDTDFDGIADTVFSGIWIINAKTGYKQPLIRHFGYPAWSPDGSSLAMHRGGQIFTVDILSLEPARIDTGSILQLTFVGRNFFPAWSPDRNWIAYDNTTNCGSSVEPPATESCGILIIRADGSDKTFLTRGRMPDWLPDGTDLIFIALGTNIFRLAVDDTANITQLTNSDDSDNSHPRFSPDGSEIAMYSKSGTELSAIWIMNSDGSSLRELTDGPDWRFDWSPDGKSIVFLHWSFSNRDPIPAGNGQLWLIDTDGSNLRQLTFFEGFY